MVLAVTGVASFMVALDTLVVSTALSTIRTDLGASISQLEWHRQRLRPELRGAARVRSGWQLGRCCVGSSIGLMLLLVAVGVMSVTWMSLIAVLVLAQKLLPANAAIDVPLALAIVGVGILIVIAPSSVPGLMPPM